MYNCVYPKLGLDWNYGLKDVPTENAAEIFLRSDEYLSVNVTTPYKPLAFAAADIAAASAKLATGANLLAYSKDSLLAYNVDGVGCVSYLKREGANFDGAKVAICGSGPTALAIMHECAQAGAQSVLLLSRKSERAQSAVNGYLDTYRELLSTAILLNATSGAKPEFERAYENCKFMFGSYDKSKAAIASSDIIIDATPLGMHKDDPSPIDVSLIGENQVVFDTVYGHGETKLLQYARQVGAHAYDGRGMLVAQAVATVGIVCDINEVDMKFDNDELFDMMASAAEFDIV